MNLFDDSSFSWVRAECWKDKIHYSIQYGVTLDNEWFYSRPLSLQGPTSGCPREPWHDLHSRIDGPAAYDILTNFEERWLKASKRHGLKKMKTSHDDSLLKLERIPDILKMEEVSSLHQNDPEDWHVQVKTKLQFKKIFVAKNFPDLLLLCADFPLN